MSASKASVKDYIENVKKEIADSIHDYEPFNGHPIRFIGPKSVNAIVRRDDCVTNFLRSINWEAEEAAAIPMDPTGRIIDPELQLTEQTLVARGTRISEQCPRLFALTTQLRNGGRFLVHLTCDLKATDHDLVYNIEESPDVGAENRAQLHMVDRIDPAFKEDGTLDEFMKLLPEFTPTIFEVLYYDLDDDVLPKLSLPFIKVEADDRPETMEKNKQDSVERTFRVKIHKECVLDHREEYIMREYLTVKDAKCATDQNDALFAFRTPGVVDGKNGVGDLIWRHGRPFIFYVVFDPEGPAEAESESDSSEEV